MSYCINPTCGQPTNPDSQKYCQACGSRLTLDEELLYRAVQPLVCKSDTQLYEVVDIQGQQAVLKVLSTQSARLIELFDRETEILKRLTHTGIPEFKRAFRFVTQAGVPLSCLVMEKIEGQNLEQWLHTHIPPGEALALKWLKQLSEILSVVHRSGFLHQDIKPANIICQSAIGKTAPQLMLVDFSNISGIVSAGFTPPEQADGNATFASDFFALGRTMVYLLTGKHPLNLPKDPQTQQLLWQNQAAQISEPFAQLINALMAPKAEHRPQSALEILVRIDEIQEQQVEALPRPTEKLSPQPRVKRSQIAALALGLSGWGLAIFLGLKQFPLSISAPVCNAERQDAISCGEESFLPDHRKNSQVPEQKKLGIDAFAASDYGAAVQWFTEARRLDPSDPETLIYLNNARLAKTQAVAYTIAIVVPISTRVTLSQEALRGIAQVQEEVNQKKKIRGRGLRVLVADDANDEAQAKEVATRLVKRSDILGVVGHYTSEMTLATVPIYQAHGLVMVSYGSTSADLSAYGVLENHVFFRTVPTTQVSAIALAGYLKDRSAHQKVAVFYNPRSPFSRSLRDWFELGINSFNGVIFDRMKTESVTNAPEIFDLCQDPFDSDRYLNYVQTQKATAIAIFPDGKVCESSYPNAIDMIPTRPSTLPIVGSWLFSSSFKDSQNIKPNQLKNLVLAAPWNRFSPQVQNSSFLRQSDSLWMKTDQLIDDKVSGLTAVTHDAALVLVRGLEALESAQRVNRADIQKILSAKDFQAEGATGTIRFRGGDRQEPVNLLLKVVPSKFCNLSGRSFVPINSTHSSSQILDCSKLSS